MEAAMKTFPASIPTKQRWVQIGGEVDGMSAKSCFARFKAIAQKLKEEKAAKEAEN